MIQNGSPLRPPLLTVLGEGIVDLVPTGVTHEFRAHAGGSPLNVAVGLARLGNSTRLMARLAESAMGRLLRAHAVAEGVDVSFCPSAAEQACLAVVSFDAEAKASYDFYMDGAADWRWTPAELATLGSAASMLHFGSLASWTPPGSDYIHAAVAALYAQDQILISYDPNVRPLLMSDGARSRAVVEASVSVAHIAKASRDDLDWLYPGVDIDQVAARWQSLGAALVVITDGPDGAHAYHQPGGAIHRAGRQVAVVDTVGAGDAFTSGLLSALAQRDLGSPQAVRSLASEALVDAIDEAILVSSRACERGGADPPYALPRSNGDRREKMSLADLRATR